MAKLQLEIVFGTSASPGARDFVKFLEKKGLLEGIKCDAAVANANEDEPPVFTGASSMNLMFTLTNNTQLAVFGDVAVELTVYPPTLSRKAWKYTIHSITTYFRLSEQPKIGFNQITKFQVNFTEFVGGVVKKLRESKHHVKKEPVEKPLVEKAPAKVDKAIAVEGKKGKSKKVPKVKAKAQVATNAQVSATAQ